MLLATLVLGGVSTASAFGGGQPEQTCSRLMDKVSCTTSEECIWDTGKAVACQAKERRTVELMILQTNDVYELDGTGGGVRGGMQRVATMKKDLQEEYDNVICVLAGDMLSPSALSRSKILDDDYNVVGLGEGTQRLEGLQMMNVSNMFVDLAVFGNHEFDLKEAPFYSRMSKAQFPWLGSNLVFTEPVEAHVPYIIKEISSPHGDIKACYVGIAIDSNQPNYVKIDDFYTSARDLKALVSTLKTEEECKLIVGLTHLSANADLDLAEFIPDIDIIVGGHDHVQNEAHSRCSAPVFKADSNAKTAYQHRLVYDFDQDKTWVYSELKEVSEAIPDDPEVAEMIEYWFTAALDPSQRDPVATLTEPLDATEATVRFVPNSPIMNIFNDAHLANVGGDLAVTNTGTFRLDDIMQPGDIRPYDVSRLLPFGGDSCVAEIMGSDLKRWLDEAQMYPGCGCFFSYSSNVVNEDGTWTISGAPLDETKTYRVSSGQYTIENGDQNFEWIPEVLTLDPATCTSQPGVMQKQLVEMYPMST
jgi:5'-nucleotidase/UDP-sugar diphosphatase